MLIFLINKENYLLVHSFAIYIASPLRPSSLWRGQGEGVIFLFQKLGKGGK